MIFLKKSSIGYLELYAFPVNNLNKCFPEVKNDDNVECYIESGIYILPTSKFLLEKNNNLIKGYIHQSTHGN